MSQTSKTVDHALRLLLHIAEKGPATTLDISRRLQLNRTVVHRLLKTLEMHEFVTRDGSTYRVGLGALRMAGQVEGELRTWSAHGLEYLCDLFSETVVLSVPHGTQGVVIDQRFSSRGDAQIRYRIGFRFSLAYSGHGRAILAYAPPSVVDAVTAELDPEDAERLSGQLQTVRRQGLAYSRNELRSGTSGLAAPILDRTGAAVGSIGIVTPVGRFPDRKVVAAETQKVSEEISTRVQAAT